jgi:hypothetical protein
VSAKKEAEVKIIIEILPIDDLMSSTKSEFQLCSTPTRGCITIFVQSKPAEKEGF